MGLVCLYVEKGAAMNPRIDPLNRLLHDHLGSTPDGRSMYKWIHSRDSELFVWIGRLNSLDVKAAYEFTPQVHIVRWVLAKWMEPPSKRWWEVQFKGQVGYPEGGYYTACSTPSDKLLENGVEPTERITMYIIELRKHQIDIGQKGVMDAIAERRIQNDKDRDREMDAALSDRWTSGNPVVPGATPEKFTQKEDTIQ